MPESRDFYDGCLTYLHDIIAPPSVDSSCKSEWLVGRIRHPELSEFVAAQRQQWRTQTLPAQRMARLQQLDFVFDQTQPEWDRRYSELKAFHAEFGHCCVPQR